MVPDVVIIIPVYKPQPTTNEVISLTQCLRILGKYPFVLVAPESLNTSFYEAVCAEKVNWSIIRFDDGYFTGIAGYNRLMLSASFYKTFLDYQYLLIYQLDAFVFKDELEYWCAEGYDYVGAPWPNFSRQEGIYHSFSLSRYAAISRLKKLLLKIGSKNVVVGNGGFSLRKVSSFYLACLFFQLAAKKWVFQEDEFFSVYVPAYCPFYKVAPENMAYRFAMEIKPSAFFKKNNYSLPFGCHAWEKHEFDFWKPHIEQYGYTINN